MKVPNSDISLTFSNYGALLYQTDVSLCLLEGMSDLFAMAVRQKGNGFFNSNSAPAFRLKAGHAVNALRGLGLFMSMYGYYGVDFDIFSDQDGHVGVGLVGK
ncbi:MAG: hypothetical protein LQ348_001881 [Seirophora lacunosa]|nr:MAG: hypothetical protein LQ344_003269 [Seirophora lacunosa]KAI4199442.1 MAG: hypothetical protein LQ348_001881 [Seirophora lacunosa]